MTDYGYDYWNLVVLNVIIFGLFILFIPFKKKVQRIPSSVYLAFIVALYAEMYGFPLTIYILSWLVGYQNPLTHTSGHILAPIISEDLFFLVVHPLSNIMLLAGILLIVLGWQKIHFAQEEMVTTDLYSYVRHPQYLGFLTLTLGMIVQWATIPTLLMWPLLVVLYYRLAKHEEKEMEEKFGERYREYRSKVSMFLPLQKLKRGSAH